MKKLIVGALLVAAAGFGCQRTYEDRSAGYRENRTETAQANTTRGDVEYGEQGQQEDVNLSQDMIVEEEEAYGGSGSAGMTDESGYGGAGDAGMMMGHGMHHMDGGMMMHHMDAGMGTDAGMMMKKKAK